MCVYACVRACVRACVCVCVCVCVLTKSVCTSATGERMCAMARTTASAERTKLFVP